MEEVLNLLIAERAPWLYRDRPISNVVRACMNGILGYKKTVALGKTLEQMPADDIMWHVSRLVAQNVSVSGLSNLPASGPALVVANHPTGISDGIVMHKLLAARRPDVFFFANHDILRVLPQLSEMIAPVEWRLDKRCRATTRETMTFTRKALEAGRLGVIFPSGRLAKRHGLHLHERPWMASAAMIARKFDIPVVPVRIGAHNSALFYCLDALHPTLRDITLFHETLNKARHHFDVTVGRPIAPAELPVPSDQAIEWLKQRVLHLDAKSPALPLIRRASPKLGRDKDNVTIRWSRRV
jgi:putative hemolysin